MNAPVNAKPLSAYLKAMAKEAVFDQETLERANELPGAKLQEQALDRYREETRQLMKRIVAEYLDQASAPSVPGTNDRLRLRSVPGTGDAVDSRFVPGTGDGKGFWGILLKSAGQDQLDQVLPWWGRTGTMIRERFTVDWFRRHKAGALAACLLGLWFLWGIAEAVFPFVAAPFKWTWGHTFAHPAPVAVAGASVDQPAGTSVSRLSSVPVPTGLGAELIDGHRLRFHWNAPGPGYRYNLYSRKLGFTGAYDKETPQPTAKTTGVWTPLSNSQFEFVITALDPEDRESDYSPSIAVDMR